MTDDPTNRPPGDDHPVPPKTPPKAAMPRKGFDPANLRGGKQPGGKMMRGTAKLSLPGKSRGR